MNEDSVVDNFFFQSAHNGSMNPAVDTIAVGDTVTWSQTRPTCRAHPTIIDPFLQLSRQAHFEGLRGSGCKSTPPTGSFPSEWAIPRVADFDGPSPAGGQG